MSGKFLSKIEPLACAICNLDYPDHFAEWEQLAEENKRLLVVSSRDHGKTTFFSTLLPLFRAGNRPNYEICIISYSDEQVMKIIMGISNMVDEKDLLRSLKPKSASVPWSKTHLVFPNRSYIKGLSFGSSGRGGHYDLVLVDDPVKDFGGMDPDDQERYFKNAIVPMVKPDGQLIVVGTYVYEGDLVERVEGNKAYLTKQYPAIMNNKPLWPKRWPLEKLSERRAEVGHVAFSREYMLEKIDPATQFFKKELFRKYSTFPDSLATVLSVDPAITLNGDATAMMLTGTSVENKTYLLDYANMRTDNVQAMLDRLFTMLMAWQCKHVIIETIGFQRLLKHWIYEEMRKRNYYFGVEEIKSHQKSKQARIMSLQPRLQAGSFLFGENHDEVIEQFLSFPRGNHDDMIDALSMQVGFWDLPSKPVHKVPRMSWNWWSSQLKPKGGDYRSALFAEFQGPSTQSSLVNLT